MIPIIMHVADNAPLINSDITWKGFGSRDYTHDQAVIVWQRQLFT